ncbi:alpha/beta fold hydrolase [Oryzobacter telluris]|uniref:alpha/beta fold hydrolase n=1 Tax=Oryzobacter telluris TaxID=3149179 RepID=UPI00370DD712
MPRPVRVVLLHGSQLSGAQWARYEALLGPDVDVVVPDLPAHGSRRGEPFTWEAALAVVGEAVEGGDPSVPVVLVGHSLGGYLAMAWASEHPTRLAGLGLLGATAVPAGPGAALYRGIARLEGRLGVDRMSRALDRQFDTLLPDELAALIKEAGYGFDGIPAAWDGVMTRCRPSMLAAVTCPVLLVAGQFDQLRVDARRFARAARSARWVRSVTVHHGLHVFPLTHPHDTAAALWELVTAAREPASP